MKEAALARRLAIGFSILTMGWVAFADESTQHRLTLPIRMVKNATSSIYTHAEICQYSKEHFPQKQLAMVIVKTHICDPGTQVCLKTAALVADPANKFVHDNFVVFHTRFKQNGVTIENSGEREIRDEWKKYDSNPEYIILDVNSCKEIFRQYAYQVFELGMFWTNGTGSHLDFNSNYRALRFLLLSEPQIASALGGRYTQSDEKQIQSELWQILKMRASLPQPSLDEVMLELNIQDRELGLTTQRGPRK